MKKIALVGATDRYNYGDLLFPIIVEAQLRKRLGSRLEFYNLSTTESDLSRVGGLKTERMSMLKDTHFDSTILIGGEVLSASWKATYYHVQKNKFMFFCKKIMFKIMGNTKSEQYIKDRFGIDRGQIFPWVIDKNLIKSKKILYNTVSGTNINYIINNSKEFNRIIQQADFISVRDNKTLSNIKKIAPKMDGVQLVPDSAFLMSDVFPISKLEHLVEKTEEKNNDSEKVLVFQVGRTYAQKNEDKIVDQLTLIAREGWKIKFLPIGYARLHEDSVSLEKIKKMLSNKSIDVDIIFGGIYDIMYTIATADMFMGTSLHGNLTALSYGVPSIALDKRVEKLSEFLRTFGTVDQQFGIEYGNIYDAFKVTQKIDKNSILRNSEIIKEKINENFDKMAQVIEK